MTLEQLSIDLIDLIVLKYVSNINIAAVCKYYNNILICEKKSLLVSRSSSIIWEMVRNTKRCCSYLCNCVHKYDVDHDCLCKCDCVGSKSYFEKNIILCYAKHTCGRLAIIIDSL